MWQIIKKTFKPAITLFFILVIFLAGFPSSVLLDRVGRIGQTITDRNVVDVLYHATKKTRDVNIIDKGFADLLRPRVEKAQAATYQIQTGYYIGNGASKSITGLGFSPQMIVIKSNTAATAALLKTTAMPAVNTAYLGSATADSTAGLTRLDADGFTITGVANTANVRYTWTAFTGSDCSASGVFCIGSYQGTAAAKAITTGFQPDLVLVKAATAVSPSWRSSAMPVNAGQYFAATAQDTAGALFTTIDATGFTVGATNSPTGVTVYYAVFKAVANSIAVGTYTGNATDNTNIAVSGFSSAPNFVFLKNANAVTAVSAVYNISESYGDSSSYFAATANLVDSIQALQSTGFQIGANSTSNGSGNTIYYATFGGAAAKSSGSGTFKMASGSYAGTAAVQTINNLGFTPDLVIIKGNTTQAGVFRTKMITGDFTAYLDSATANFAGGITALNPDGFTVGTNAAVNSSGIIYYWTAYGNAWNPDTNSGAADFTIGAYYGNGVAAARSIIRLPFQPNLISIKSASAVGGVFKTSAHSGTISSFYTATADAASGQISSLDANGFTLGTTVTNTNVSATVIHYFGFKSGSNFTVNSYTGTGASQNITSVGFQPDNIWVKRTTAVQGVSRTSSQAADSALPFINVASITAAITGIISTGFTVNTATETNASGGSYRYAAWKNNSTPTTPAYKIQTGYYIGNGASKSVTGLGFSPQMIVIKSNTTAIAALLKTTAMPAVNTAYLGSATADSTAGLTALNADGFTVTGVANTANVRYTWTAFTGSDCSASGVFCIGSYQGAGSGTKAVTTGFQPDLVLVKAATAVSPSWRSSAMPANYGQYFAATAQDTASALFTTIDAAGFTVGLTNNAAATYYYVAFKQVAGSVKVGAYTGNGFDNINITGIGFVPDWVFLKNAPTAVSAVYNIKESYGDSSSYFTATANIPDIVQFLQTDGFQIGTNSASNGLNNIIYYAAFAGAAAHSSGSGTFQMVSGSYTGTAQVQSIGNLGFTPDLVIIKGNTTQAGAFRMRMMEGDITAYLDAATTNFAGGITALNPNGFTVGTSVVVNTNAITYYWTAYGNAWNPDTNSGAADFTIGAYYGNGIDDRDITRLPFKPDMVAIKVYAATAGVFRTSAHSGDLASYFAATAEAANLIQAFNNDGFRVGTAGNVNTAASVHYFFAFKSGANFTVNSYTGTGASQNITSVGFQPDNIWVKRTTAVQGVSRTSSQAADSALPFINVASITAAITGIISTGFTVNTATETNASGGNYRYVAWKATILWAPSPTITTYINTTESGLNYAVSCSGCGARLGGGAGFRQSVTVTGLDFGTVSAGSRSTSANNIKVGAHQIADANVTAWTPTSITFLTDSAVVGDTDTEWGTNFGGIGALVVTFGSRASAGVNFYIFPQVTSITQPAGLSADTAREYDAGDTDGVITLNGTRFGNSQGTGSVTIVAQASTIDSWTNTAIQARVSSAITDTVNTGSISMTQGVGANGKTHTYANTLRVLPRITGFNPTSASVGTAVTVNGNHFCQGASCPVAFGASDKVTFSTSIDATVFTSWSATAIVTAVPAGAMTGNVVATSNSYTSNGSSFTVISNTPPSPTSLNQWKNSGFTQAIGISGSASSTPIYLTMTMSVPGVSGGTLYSQIEYKPIGTPFVCTGTDACVSDAVQGPAGFAGPGPVDCMVSNCAISITPSDNVYHWQARTKHTISTVDYYSAWVSFDGANPETATDFYIDTTAPNITNVSESSPGSNDATITWSTANEISTSRVEYDESGTFTGGYDCAGTTECTALADISPMVNSHSVLLNNLNSGTTYYYRVRSKDAAGNESMSINRTFTTSSVSQPAKTTKAYIDGATGAVSSAITYYFTLNVPEVSPGMQNAYVEVLSVVSGGNGTVSIQVNGGASRAYTVSAASPTFYRFLYKITNPEIETYMNLNDIAPCSNSVVPGTPPLCNKIIITPATVNMYVLSTKIITTYVYTP